MNSDPECNCCPPSTCDACKPQCSSKRYLRIRAERPLKNDWVCSEKNCIIFGGHDTDPMPEYTCNKKYSNTKDEKIHPLGSPIGLVTSSINFKPEDKSSDNIQAQYATYLKAFARLHLNDEKAWDPLLIDDILAEGLQLYTSSQLNETTEEEKSPSHIYMPNETIVPREFELSGFTFYIELMPPFKQKVTSSSEIGAKGDGAVVTLEDFMPLLKDFFRQNTYGLLKIKSFYVMIWRVEGAYFVFDARGRRVSDFKTDKDNGLAMLICLRSLENVRHLIANLSGLRASDPLIIRELKVVKVITPDGTVMQKDFNVREHQYQVINDDYAYIKSELHLSLNKGEMLRNRSGLAVAVAAIVASKINHPATWDIKMIDKIICFGVKFFHSCWLTGKMIQTNDVYEFPTSFTMGQFLINIELLGHKYGGIWRCVPGFKHSELSHAIKSAFDEKHSKLILQINYQTYAIWKKHEFVYLLDPYRHRILGKQNESENYDQMEKSATVRMFRSFEVFMNVLNYILLDSNRTSQFFIHIIQVKDIQAQQKGIQPSCISIEEPKHDAYGEVVSINEHICFEEAEDVCKTILGEISDYDDEDLKSDVVEIELKTSSSEEDLLEEEEEQAGSGSIEEIEGLETSSSGEEGDGHKKKKHSGEDRGKRSKSRTKKGKRNKKGDSSSSKKGEGNDDTEEIIDSKKGTTSRYADKNVKPSEVAKSKDGQNKDSDQNKEDLRKDKGKELDTKRDIPTESLDANREQHKYIAKDQDEKRSQDQEFGKTTDKDMNSGDVSKQADQDKQKDLAQDGVITEDEKPRKDQDVSKTTDKNMNKGDLSKQEDQEKQKDLAKDRAVTEDEKRRKDQDFSNSDKNVYRVLSKQENQIKQKDLSKGRSVSDDKNLSKGQDFNKATEKNMYKDLDKKGDQTKVKEGLSSDKDATRGEDRETKLGLHENRSEEKDSNKENAMTNGLSKYDKNYMAKDNETKTLLDGKSKEQEGKISGKERYQKDHNQLYDDGGEADDENEDSFEKKQRYCSIPNPNRYPGYFKHPVHMAVVGSESGSYGSICKLIQTAFKVADRLLLMTPWGNFVLFRCIDNEDRNYFLFDGCTCNFELFRRLDLSIGTAGLICFKHTHNVIAYIRNLRKSDRNQRKKLDYTVDDICKEYFNKSLTLRL